MAAPSAASPLFYNACMSVVCRRRNERLWVNSAETVSDRPIITTGRSYYLTIAIAFASNV